MPRAIVVKIDWSVKKPKTIFDILMLIISGFTQYATLFAKPPIDVNGLKDIQSEVNDRFSKRKNGDVARKEYEDALAKADTALREDAKYVSDLAKGDETIILKSGYTPTKGTAQKATVIPAQAGVPRAKATVGGFIALDCDPIADATTYTYLIFWESPLLL